MLSLIFGMFLGMSGLFVFENRRALKVAIYQACSLNMSFSATSLIGLGMIYQIFLNALRDRSTVRVDGSNFQYIEVSDEERNSYGIMIPPKTYHTTCIKVNENSNLYRVKRSGLIPVVPGEHLNELSKVMKGFEHFVVFNGSHEIVSDTWNENLYISDDDDELPIE